VDPDFHIPLIETVSIVTATTSGTASTSGRLPRRRHRVPRIIAPAARRVHVQSTRPAGGGGDSPSHGIGDVMELQIEKDAIAEPGELFDDGPWLVNNRLPISPAGNPRRRSASARASPRGAGVDVQRD
jgi:hypothetical protein